MASRKKSHPGQLDLFADAGAIPYANDCIAALATITPLDARNGFAHCGYALH